MGTQHVKRQNFSGGEQENRMWGRTDLAILNNGCRRAKNFILDVQGNARFRPGTVHTKYSKGNAEPHLEVFKFNDEQVYLLEFTDYALRFHQDSGPVLESSKTITNITAADPGVVTCGTHGFSNGDEVYIADGGGVVELEGRYFVVANKTGTTFELNDHFGNNIDTSGMTAYSSGGTVERVYTLTTPYAAADDLTKLSVDQDGNTMYIDHEGYLPRKLTRTSATSWTLALYTRTGDPFTDQQTITAITQADPGVVTTTFTAGAYVDGDTVFIEDISAGPTELNSKRYIVTNQSGNDFELYDEDGNSVDTSSWTAWSAGGYVTNKKLSPAVCAMYESRLWHGRTPEFPGRIFASRSPEGPGGSDPGATRYEDYTAGSNADDALNITLNGEVNKVRWLTGTDRAFVVGSVGSAHRITGSTADAAITPTSIKARPFDRVGVKEIPPVNKEGSLLFVQAGGRRVRTMEYDVDRETFVSDDKNLTSVHITESTLKRLAWQTGSPDIMWALRTDGLLIGLTAQFRENIFGWHRHPNGEDWDDEVVSIATTPREGDTDRLWLAVKRVVNSNTTYSIEYMSDPVELPERIDYYTDDDSEEDDDDVFDRAMSEAQKGYIFVDASLSYDGSTLGTDNSATLTPGATTGTSITFTASASVFTSAMVGRELWKKAVSGAGTGRATITAFSSGTEVTCDIDVDFDSTDAIAAGNWYLTAGSFSNLGHLEGRSVTILTDGGVHPNETVSSGAVTLDYQASVVHVGLTYEGLLQPSAIETQDSNGDTQIQEVTKIGLRLLNTLSLKIGTDVYNLSSVPLANWPLAVGQANKPYTGTVNLPVQNGITPDTVVTMRQESPLPATIQMMEVYGTVDDD